MQARPLAAVMGSATTISHAVPERFAVGSICCPFHPTVQMAAKQLLCQVAIVLFRGVILLGKDSKLRASSASVTSAALSTTNEEDPTFTCAELARSLHC
ncbi:hypothetical protein BH20ACI3_BH20ACI3_24650 [soil metagenome]